MNDYNVCYKCFEVQIDDLCHGHDFILGQFDICKQFDICNECLNSMIDNGEIEYLGDGDFHYTRKGIKCRINEIEDNIYELKEFRNELKKEKSYWDK